MYKIHKVEAEEKLKDIAEKYNVSVEEIKEANPNMSFFKELLGDEYADSMQTLKIPYFDEKNQEEANKAFKNVIKYRCEQAVTTRINGVPTSHMQTKRDYDFYRRKEENYCLTKVCITDNIVNSFSDYYKQILDMVTDLDKVKYDNIIISTDEEGGIRKILNMKHIIKSWEFYKSKLEAKYSNLYNPKGANAIANFIQLSEQQVTNEKNLIDALKTDMFFFVLYNKYLVGHESKLDDFSIPFSSQLFEGIITDLNVTQKIIEESPDKVLISKVSEMPRNIDENRIMKMYDKKYKPVVQYKFSKYNARFSENMLFNKKENYVEESEITIEEEVQNNINVLISFNLKKIN